MSAGARFLQMFLFIVGLASLAVVAALVLALLAMVGEVEQCSSGGRPVFLDEAHASSFREKWDGLNAQLDAGQQASVSLDESEVTSRATSWLEEKDAPIEQLTVCIHQGSGTATAEVDTPFFGRNVSVRVDGTVDLSGSHPKAQVDDIKVGGLPGFLSGVVKGLVEDVIDDQLEDVELKHRYSLDLQEGVATVTGTPAGSP